MLWAVKNGFIGVNATYRLAPEFRWPAGPEDLASVVSWVTSNIASYGGNPARVYLMGISAGAVHVASFLSHPEFHGSGDDGLAGAILVSGLYDLSNMPAAESLSVYFGEDTANYAARSSLAGLLETTAPLLIVSSELDPPIFEQQFDLLRNNLRDTQRGYVRAVVLPQHSHTSPVCAINTADSSLTSEILNFTATATYSPLA
jgi:triacylglycerol lipase